jgi:hypothetical protein
MTFVALVMLGRNTRLLRESRVFVTRPLPPPQTLYRSRLLGPTLLARECRVFGAHKTQPFHGASRVRCRGYMGRLSIGKNDPYIYALA